MFQFKKLFTLATIAGLAISTLPLISAKAQQAPVQNLAAKLSASQPASNLPEAYKKNGWGESSETTKSGLNGGKTSNDKLQNAKLQAGGNYPQPPMPDTSNYLCGANYFATPTSRYVESSAADQAGNIYTSGSEMNTYDHKIYKTSSTGTITVTSTPTGLYNGKILSNSAGDVYQINLDSITYETKIYKIPTGTSQYNLIYTISSDKYTGPEGFQIDNSGNLYIPYSPNSAITSGSIEKISPNGALLQTFATPNDAKSHLSRFVVSEAGLLYLLGVEDAFGNGKFYVLNTDGTQKGTFPYPAATPMNTSSSIVRIPNGVADGGVYVNYQTSSAGTSVKRIKDTDTLPISSTPDYSIPSGNYGSPKMFVDHNNSYMYFTEPYNKLSRINVATAAIEDVLPLYKSYEINAVLNSSNQIVFAKSSNSDLFKLDCSVAYTPTSIAATNVSLAGGNCNYLSTGLAENNTYHCNFDLRKGISYVIPSTFLIQLEGSGSPTGSCNLINSYYQGELDCPSVSGGSLNTTTSRNVQVNTSCSPMTTVGTTISWQPFSAWASNNITLAGKTEELVVGSKLYQAAHGTDNGLYLRSMDTSGVFTSWNRLSSITIKGTPTLSVDPNGDLFVFAHGTDNGLYFWKVGEVGGEKWRRMGSITIKDAVTVHSFNGKFWLYATGTDNGAYVAKFSSFGTLSYTNPTWTKSGSITVETTMQGAVVDSKLYQIAIGTDNGLYYRTTDSSEVASGWVRFNPYGMRYGSDSDSYNKLSKPVVDGTKLALSVTSGNTVSYLTTDFTRQNSDFESYFDSRLPTNLSLFAGKLVEAGYGTDGKLYHINIDRYGSYGYIYSTWIQGNNITVKDAPTQVVFNDKQYQFVRGTDNKLWTRSRS